MGEKMNPEKRCTIPARFKTAHDIAGFYVGASRPRDYEEDSRHQNTLLFDDLPVGEAPVHVKHAIITGCQTHELLHEWIRVLGSIENPEEFHEFLTAKRWEEPWDTPDGMIDPKVSRFPFPVKELHRGSGGEIFILSAREKTWASSSRRSQPYKGEHVGLGHPARGIGVFYPGESRTIFFKLDDFRHELFMMNNLSNHDILIQDECDICMQVVPVSKAANGKDLEYQDLIVISSLGGEMVLFGWKRAERHLFVVSCGNLRINHRRELKYALGKRCAAEFFVLSEAPALGTSEGSDHPEALHLSMHHLASVKHWEGHEELVPPLFAVSTSTDNGVIRADLCRNRSCYRLYGTQRPPVQYRVFAEEPPVTLTKTERFMASCGEWTAWSSHFRITFQDHEVMLPYRRVKHIVGIASGIAERKWVDPEIAIMHRDQQRIWSFKNGVLSRDPTGHDHPFACSDPLRISYETEPVSLISALHIARPNVLFIADTNGALVSWQIIFEPQSKFTEEDEKAERAREEREPDDLPIPIVGQFVRRVSAPLWGRATHVPGRDVGEITNYSIITSIKSSIDGKRLVTCDTMHSVQVFSVIFDDKDNRVSLQSTHLFPPDVFLPRIIEIGPGTAWAKFFMQENRDHLWTVAYHVLYPDQHILGYDHIVLCNDKDIDPQRIEEIRHRCRDDKLTVAPFPMTVADDCLAIYDQCSELLLSFYFGKPDVGWIKTPIDKEPVEKKTKTRE